MTTPAAHLSTSELLAAAAARHRQEDPLYTEPYLDVDEARDTPSPHRYLHGGFTGTALKFSIYLPPHHRYAGRFFQPVLPISGFENASTMGMLDGMAGTIGFAHDSGAILVESNMGTPTPHPGDDPTIPGFRGSAATARFARCIAAVVYGEHRAYGYVYGGSGGAFKTIACVENAPDVWDGAVPFVQGSPVAIPNVFAVQAHAMRVLAGKWDQIVDAIEPGGSGDMYAGLTVEERDALAEVTRFGFPPRSWFDVRRIRSGYTAMWGAFAAGIKGLDPEYFRDFWTVPGYLGADSPDSLKAAHIDRTLKVASLVGPDEAEAAGLPVSMAQRLSGAGEVAVGVRFEGLPDIDLFGASLTFTSGAAAGRTLLVSAVTDGIVSPSLAPGGGNELAGVAVSDEVHLDNSDYLAFQTLHRHQVAEGYDAFDQFVVNGVPKYPQRSRLVGPALARGSWGHQQTGRFRVKMIALASMLDEAAYPWQPDWYRRRVHEAMGAAATDHHRLWYVDHAQHGEPSPVMVAGDTMRPARLARTVSYNGTLEQAVRDVVQWVEQGIAPAPDTNYSITDAQVTLHGDAHDRGGIQPVVTLTANGSVRADVRVGEAVTFVGHAATPGDLGRIVRAEWDFDGDASYPQHDAGVDGSLGKVTVRTTHTFDTPGTYFPVLRITAQRQGLVDSPYGHVQNLGRVRVVVTAD